MVAFLEDVCEIRVRLCAFIFIRRIKNCPSKQEKCSAGGSCDHFMVAFSVFPILSNDSGFVCICVVATLGSFRAVMMAVDRWLVLVETEDAACVFARKTLRDIGFASSVD